MMKRYLALICTVVCMLASSFPALAGSIPEDLLASYNTKVFLGNVSNYTTKEIPSEPYTMIDSVEVIPTQKIKGDVTIDEKQTYTNCYGASELTSGVEYLFGYIDENNFYVYEIEAIEDNQFKLVHSDTDDMIKRLETYLNDGSFEKAENDRLSKMEPSQQDNPVSSVTSEADTTATNTAAASDGNIWLIVGVGAIIVAAILWIAVKKKK